MSSTKPSSRTDSLRLNRLRLGALTLGIPIILAFVISSAYDASRSHYRAIVMTDRELSNVANALAEQTAWTFRAVDLLLLETAQWYGSDAVNMPLERINEILESRTAGVKQVSLVTIVDAHGTPLYRSRG